MFTAEDRSFIRAILSHPAELTAWLVYADWLDKRDDPRAEFIRLEFRRGQLRTTDPAWGLVESRLRELRGSLDPDWVSIFDRPKIENCDEAFAFKCPKHWENLDATADNSVRHCAGCKKLVYYCRTLPEAQNHARQGHCVAVQLGVLRYPEDLESNDSATNDADADVIGFFDPYYTPPDPPRRPWWKFW
ncbi:TIGR02996 domain-containing protein [Frigoriglobus tundricola]|uniref:TIGR02996 domain-containing protein n=1 Tax=Frigoriglobus tundricola TaxID=2774151 RepID=A0A6M5YW56_9BACT|nr:TIGR02996 domain-containing protein [Frigoriglobus tundricola]QJW98168.1 hypothetical protein FTUN_5748 [Frigoriglobus tundricola]